MKKTMIFVLGIGIGMLISKKMVNLAIKEFVRSYREKLHNIGWRRM